MTEIKNISLVAHDNRKKDLIEWVEWNYETLIPHNLIAQVRPVNWLNRH